MAGLRERKAQFSNDKMQVFLRDHIEADLLKLEQRVNSFVRQFAEFPSDAQQRDDCFRFFRRLLNYDSWRWRPSQRPVFRLPTVNQDIEAEQDHFRVGTGARDQTTRTEILGLD